MLSIRYIKQANVIKCPVWHLVLYIYALFTLASCQSRGQRQEGKTELLTRGDSLDFAFEVRVRYARGFAIKNYPQHKELYFLNPSNGDTLSSYKLRMRTDKEPSDKLGGNDTQQYIAVPRRSLACFSTTSVGALPLLGLSQQLIGCGNLNYICDSLLQERIRGGLIKEIARGMSHNIEQIIALRPELLLLDSGQDAIQVSELRTLGVEAIAFNNWQESSLLARAEWLKLIALLMGRNQVADSLFNDIERSYLDARELASRVSQPLPILYGQEYQGAWYIPGEQSYVHNMLTDAGLQYEYKPGQAGSQPVSFEYVYSQHSKAKIWLCPLPQELESKADLIKLNKHYAHFEALRSGEVWTDRKRINNWGGNDIWERGIYQPHLILRDLIKIAHPDLLPYYDTTYWQALKP